MKTTLIPLLVFEWCLHLDELTVFVCLDDLTYFVCLDNSTHPVCVLFNRNFQRMMFLLQRVESSYDDRSTHPDYLDESTRPNMFYFNRTFHGRVRPNYLVDSTHPLIFTSIKSPIRGCVYLGDSIHPLIFTSIESAGCVIAYMRTPSPKG